MANSRDYRNPNYTEKIKLQRFFTQLQIAASFFKEHFVGKIMYYETEIESVELHFSPTNFMHLCGVDYRKGAGSFFDDCLNRHVIIDELKIKKDGTTMQKLQVLGSIEELLGKHVHLTGQLFCNNLTFIGLILPQWHRIAMFYNVYKLQNIKD